MKKQSGQSSSGEVLAAPAYPLTGSQLFNGLRLALAQVLGFQPTFARLGRIVGQESNLTHYWFQVLPHTHLIAFLALLERLPDRKRLELLNEFCRELPNLEHPRLAHDPIAVTAMENLLRSAKGLTLVRGGNAFQRTFVATALGHSLARLHGPAATVAGVDLHPPTRWVPLEGVVYFTQPISLARVKQLLLATWPRIRSSESTLILLNGVWSNASEIHLDVLHLARDRQVVLADGKMPDPRSLAESIGGPVHVITIAAPAEQERRIRVTVEAL